MSRVMDTAHTVSSTAHALKTRRSNYACKFCIATAGVIVTTCIVLLVLSWSSEVVKQMVSYFVLFWFAGAGLTLMLVSCLTLSTSDNEKTD